MEARVWEAADEPAARAGAGFFCTHSGASAESYRDRLQLNIRNSAPGGLPPDLDQREFPPGSYRDIDELTGYLEYFLTEVFDPDYSTFARSFFRDEDFMGRFSRAPGDAGSHHAYLGGLIEHTVSVATLCQHLAVQHPAAQQRSADHRGASARHRQGRGVHIATAVSVYSREGRLLGHVLDGAAAGRRQDQGAGGFSAAEESWMLLHAIISHHGELEWGAPKRPAERRSAGAASHR